MERSRQKQKCVEASKDRSTGLLGTPKVYEMPREFMNKMYGMKEGHFGTCEKCCQNCYIIGDAGS